MGSEEKKSKVVSIKEKGKGLTQQVKEQVDKLNIFAHFKETEINESNNKKEEAIQLYETIKSIDDDDKKAEAIRDATKGRLDEIKIRKILDIIKHCSVTVIIGVFMVILKRLDNNQGSSQ